MDLGLHCGMPGRWGLHVLYQDWIELSHRSVLFKDQTLLLNGDGSLIIRIRHVL